MIPLPSSQTILRRALRTVFPAFISVAAFSFCINLLMFVAPLFTIHLYGRVLPTRSMETLIALLGIAMFLKSIYGVLEGVRSRVLVRIGLRIDQLLANSVFMDAFRAVVRNRGLGHYQAVRDVNEMRDFLSGSAIIAFFDAPWAPIFIIACFFLHPWFGGMALLAAVVVVGLSIANELITRPYLKKVAPLDVQAESLASSAYRNGEAIWAMGMIPAVTQRWSQSHTDAIHWQAVASDRGGALLAATKFTRQAITMVTMGLACYLAIEREISPAVIFAVNLLISRAIMPVEQITQNWRSFGRAREAYERLNAVLGQGGDTAERMRLPIPLGQLTVEGVYAGPPGQSKPILRNINFAIPAGTVLAVVGPSGAGKSTLARVLIGLWPAVTGSVRLDGTEIGNWNPDDLGPHVGYVPQDLELFDGTIAENIARLQQPDAIKVLQATAVSGTHDLIQSLPQGYDTRVGVGGIALSGGQRQRIALARAVYGDPNLVIMDEPNANLDATGDDHLQAAIGKLKLQGATVVVITHKSGLLAAADMVLILEAGAVSQFGTRDEILQGLKRRSTASAAAGKLKPVSAAAG